MKSIIFLILLLSAFLFAQVITDTLWSVPELDGSIGYRPSSGIFSMSTNSFQFIPGDGFDLFLQQEVYARSYLSFNPSSISISDSINILSAVIGIYQYEAIGNSQLHTFPVWNVACGDTHFCVLDHINYGSYLDLGDWTAGDPGDPQTLHTNIGVISNNAVVEYKILDVTPYLREDVQNGRSYNQYRMRFTIDTDFDLLGDWLEFYSGNTTVGSKPYLAVEYEIVNLIANNPATIHDFHIEQNYPNPFNAITTITYGLFKGGNVKLDILDNAGKIVDILYEGYQPAGEYRLNWNAGKFASGIYFYRLNFNKQKIIKKMFLIR
ncbi:MAG: T9SS type A sorting domain-containing protein [Calditrichia bacterium]